MVTGVTKLKRISLHLTGGWSAVNTHHIRSNVLTSPGLARGTAAAVLPLLLLTACGRGNPTSTAGASSTPTTSTSSSPAASSGAAAADFGNAKAVCGPGSGTKPKASGRGLSDTEIDLGVINDAKSTLAPGLGAVYLDIAKAFTTWCNEKGGINGRKLVYTSRDSNVTEAAARVVDACQKDFMLVGGGTPFDAATVGARAACGMGSIPAYVASAENRNSDKQAIPIRAGNTQINIGAFRRLAAKYGSAFASTGMIADDNPSVLAVTDALRKAFPQAGVKAVSYQKLPSGVANLRTYVQPLVGKTKAFIPPLSMNVGMLRAMNDVGYKPEIILDAVGNSYGQGLVDALKAAPVSGAYYVGLQVWPIELADQNPTLKLAVDLTKATGTKAPIDGGIIGAWTSWLLFAQSATACTDVLTVDCVIGKAKAQTSFDAGGMLSEGENVGDVEFTGSCIAMMRVTGKGYEYDREITKPNKGIFNCDPANVVKTSG